MLKTEEVLKLIDAGFTAEQILKMDAPEKAPEEPEIKEAPPAKLEPEKKTEDTKPEQPALDPDVKAVKAVIDSALKNMAETMDKNMKSMAEAFRLQLQPSIGDVKPLGIEDVLTNFFK